MRMKKDIGFLLMLYFLILIFFFLSDQIYITLDILTDG